jgi:peptidyl-tRNA hydrolase
MYLFQIKYDLAITSGDVWSCVAKSAQSAIDLFEEYAKEQFKTWHEIVELKRVVKVHRTQKVSEAE